MKLCLLKELRVQMAQQKTKATIKQNKLKRPRKQPQLKPFQIVPTIHKDVTERLLQINPALAAEARKILDINKSERHIRGGMATKEKYAHQHA